MKKFLIALLLIASPAFAQKPNIHAPTGNIVNDTKDLFGVKGGVLTGNPTQDAQALWAKIIAANLADLQYASALAASANSPASLQRKQCWDALIVVNQQATGNGLKNVDGSPMVKPDPALITNVESLAEVIDNLSPQGKLFTACAGAAEMAKMNVLQLINGVVTGVAAIGVLGVP